MSLSSTYIISLFHHFRVNQRQKNRLIFPKKRRKWRKYLPQYRSNLRSTRKLFTQNTFWNQHITVIRKTLFLAFFQAFLEDQVDQSSCTKSDDDIVLILATYNAKRNGFLLGGKSLIVTPTNIRLIFGITGGNTKLTLKNAFKPNKPFVRRRFQNVERLTITIVREQLLEALKGQSLDDIEDVARLLCLYVIGTLFLVRTGAYMGWLHVHNIEDLNKIYTYQWPEHICETLLASVQKNHSKLDNVMGCVMALLVSTQNSFILLYSKIHFL